MNSPFFLDSGHMTVHSARSVDFKARVPGSKSLTNRFLLLAALAEGRSRITRPLESDDTRYMRQALADIGVTVACDGQDWVVNGHSKWHSPANDIFVGNAGTVMRFFSPALALGPMSSVITGNERMLVRPIGDLVEGLRQLGVTVNYKGEEGYPPLAISGPMNPGNISIRGDSSSQYLSGLLMTLPLLSSDSQISIEGDLVSRTYVEMTLNCMAGLGVQVDTGPEFKSFHIKGNQAYRAGDIDIEPDGSTASYWFGLPLMVGGKVFVEGVPRTSTQGDFGLLEIIQKMGASVTRTETGVWVESAELSGVDVDMNTMSDVAPTIAVIATMAKTPTTIRNIYNMRIKECDRIDTIKKAFDALGLKMEEGRDWMKIYPGKPDRDALLNPEDDHRMAMIFALLGLAHGGVRIMDPDCVQKTYPAFYEEIGAAFQAS